MLKGAIAVKVKGITMACEIGRDNVFEKYSNTPADVYYYYYGSTDSSIPSYAQLWLKLQKIYPQNGNF